jgi:hypothetical protein
MEMTTPVFTNTRGDMQFVIGKAAHQVGMNEAGTAGEQLQCNSHSLRERGLQAHAKACVADEQA